MIRESEQEANEQADKAMEDNLVAEEVKEPTAEIEKSKDETNTNNPKLSGEEENCAEKSTEEKTKSGETEGFTKELIEEEDKSTPKSSLENVDLIPVSERKLENPDVPSKNIQEVSCQN